MNSNTELFAVIITGEYLHSCIGPAHPEMEALFSSDDDAIARAEGIAQFDAKLYNEYNKPESGLKYEYVSTVDGRYDSEGNEIPEKEWKRVEAGNCHWDIAYTITFKDRSRTRCINVCKWVDFQ